MDKFSILPFMLTTAASAPDPQKININRVVEAVIIAAITGAITMYGTTKVLETKISAFEDRLRMIEAHENEANRVIRDDLSQVRQFVEHHIAGDRR